MEKIFNYADAQEPVEVEDLLRRARGNGLVSLEIISVIPPSRDNCWTSTVVATGVRATATGSVKMSGIGSTPIASLQNAGYDYRDDYRDDSAPFSLTSATSALLIHASQMRSYGEVLGLLFDEYIPTILGDLFHPDDDSCQEQFI